MTRVFNRWVMFFSFLDSGSASGYQYHSTSSRVAQRPGSDTELPKLPPVPSHSPDASENLSTRQKTKSLVAS